MVRHRQAIHETRRVGLAANRELRLRQPPVISRQGAAEHAARLQPRPGLANGHRAALVHGADFLRVALMLAAQHREVFVHPDEYASGIMLPLVLAAHDDEHLLVLAAHRVQNFAEVIRAALPIRPDRRHRARVLVGEFHILRQQRAHRVHIGAVFEGQQFAIVVPRHRRQNAGLAGRGSRVIQSGHGGLCSQRAVCGKALVSQRPPPRAIRRRANVRKC